MRSLLKKGSHLPLGDQVSSAIASMLDEGGDRKRVAFDADGTLWRGDVGEDLLRFLAAQGKLPRYRNRRGVYEEYERRVAKDPADAYARRQARAAARGRAVRASA